MIAYQDGGRIFELIARFPAVLKNDRLRLCGGNLKSVF